MGRASKKSRQSSYAAEALAIKSGTEQLDEIARIRSEADFEITNILYSSIQNHKTLCLGLLDRRAACLQEIASSHPKVAQALDKDGRYFMPVPERAIFDKGGIVISFRPDDDHLDLNLLGPAPLSVGCSSDADIDPSKISIRPVESEPSQQVTKTTLREKRSNPGEMSLEPMRFDSIYDSIKTNPRTRKTITTIDRTSSRVEMKHPARLNPTLQPPITMSMAKKGNYWIFEYSFSRTAAFFVMRCISPSCQHPAFSKHPLKNDRAAQHLRECNLPFKNERDMVRRYARLVTPDKGRKVTSSWAKQLNRLHLAANEQYLEEENV